MIIFGNEHEHYYELIKTPTMNIHSIKEKLNQSAIFHSEGKILNSDSVIGYENKFK